MPWKRAQNGTTPLTKEAALLLKGLEIGESEPSRFVFTTCQGHQLSRDAIADRLSKHLIMATTSCPSLGAKNVKPHVLRRTAAMRLLEAGIDVAMVAIWMGHSDIGST